MSDDWCYQLNGFEIGPVPASEVRRLLLKGRLSVATPIRREGMESWITADRLAGGEGPHVPAADGPTEDPPRPPSPRLGPWSPRLLDDAGALGIPAGMALIIPWEHPGTILGALLLGALGGLLYRAILRGSRDLAAIHELARAAEEASPRTEAGR